VKNGIIMEVDKRFLTILTSDGEFMRARNLNKNYQIGQEIDFIPIEQGKMKKLFSFSPFQSFKGKIVVPTALALILLMISILPFQQNNQVYAYLSIDINPSLELGINENCQVIELIPYNEDGKKIVSELKDWKKKDVQDVTSEIMDQIRRQGYIKENHKVVLSTVYVETDRKNLNIHMQKEMEEVRESVQKEDLNVTLVNATPEDRKEAIEKGLTTGLYKEKILNSKKKEMNGQKKQIEQSIQQEEQPRPVNPAKPQEKPIEVKPPIQKEEKVETVEESSTFIPPGQIKKEEKVETVEESNTFIPPGQIKKEEKSDDNTKVIEKVKIESPIIQEVEDKEKSNKSIEPIEEKPKQKNIEKHSNKVEEHGKKSNLESKKND
jgi:hypothetical protein